MRDRLIELLEDTIQEWECDVSKETVLEIADHLIENGVIVPPCKVGDVVYRLDDIVWHSECCDCEHYRIGGFGDPSECDRTTYGWKHADCIKIVEEAVTLQDIAYYIYAKDFGKNVFLTREEAEKALKERSERDAESHRQSTLNKRARP